MANTTRTARARETPTAGEPVEVWCSFDQAWHLGFRVHRVEGPDEAGEHLMCTLARPDGTLLPTPVDATRVRPAG